MNYSLATAAAACGVNKSTVLRAIKSGKVSATKDEHGEWHVEPAELHRVYKILGGRRHQRRLSAFRSSRRFAALLAAGLLEPLCGVGKIIENLRPA